MRSDLQAAEPTPRDNWIEHSSANDRSPNNYDYMTGLHVRRWRAPQRGQTRTNGRVLMNEQYIGGTDSRVSPVDVIAELERAKAALDQRLIPGLLAEVLIERKKRGRVQAVIAERFGEMPEDDLRRLASEARTAIEGHLILAFGFLPKYQLRWVGTV